MHQLIEIVADIPQGVQQLSVFFREGLGNLLPDGSSSAICRRCHSGFPGLVTHHQNLVLIERDSEFERTLAFPLRGTASLV